MAEPAWLAVSVTASWATATPGDFQAPRATAMVYPYYPTYYAGKYYGWPIVLFDEYWPKADSHRASAVWGTTRSEWHRR